MKHTRLLFYTLLTACFLLGACQGEDGEPGPTGDTGLQGEKGDKGDAGEDGEDGQNGEDGEDGQDGEDGEDGVGFEKRGFFQGTVRGTRKDGTVFTEAFNFEYGPDYEGFGQHHYTGLPTFELYRTGSLVDESNYFYADFNVVDKGLATETLTWGETGDYTDNGSFQIIKEISPTTLFRFEGRPKFQETTVRQPINATANATFKFSYNENGRLYEEKYNVVTDESEFVFKTTDGKTVIYSSANDQYDAAGDYYYGSIVKVLNANGTVASNIPYNQLRTSRNNDYEVILRNLSGADLSEEKIVPADTYSITNYVRNTETGVVTFDITFTIGNIDRENSSTNPATITAKFNSGGKVYSDVVSRKKN